jgi:hypothetical protein
MRHAEHHLARPGRGRQLDRLVQHRDERVEALDRELLLAEERLVQVVLERLDLGEAPQQLALLVGSERRAVRPGLDRLPEPHSLLVLRDVLDLVGDRPRVCPAQAGEGLGERVAGHGHPQHGRRDAGHELGCQVDRGRVERGVADRGRPEWVEAGREVAVHPVRLDDRRGRLDRLEERGVGDRRRRRLGRGRYGLRRRHGRLRVGGLHAGG